MDALKWGEDYGRGAPGRHISQGAQPSRSHHYHERNSHRSTEAAPYGDGRHEMERGHHGRSDHQQHPPKILLDDALYDLQGVLEAAVDFYSNFIEEFEKDVQRIKPYAGPRVMEHLWANKVISGGERSRQGGRSQARQAEGHDQGHPSRSPDFKSISREVNDCFGTAIGPCASGRDSSIDPQNADRIQKKLKQAYGDVYKLMRTTLHQKSDANALITEMEMVLTLLDKTGPHRDQRDGRDSHNDQDPRGFEQPIDGGQDGFKEGQGRLPKTPFSYFLLTKRRVFVMVIYLVDFGRY